MTCRRFRLTLHHPYPVQTILHLLCQATTPELHTWTAGTPVTLAHVCLRDAVFCPSQNRDLFPKWWKCLPLRGRRDVPSSNQGENSSQLTEHSSEENKALSMKKCRRGAGQGALWAVWLLQIWEGRKICRSRYLWNVITLTLSFLCHEGKVDWYCEFQFNSSSATLTFGWETNIFRA